MTATRRLIDLFRALAAEDVSSATAIAAELCRDEDRKGHRRAAKALRGALSTRPFGATAGTENGRVLSTALTRLNANRTLSDIALSRSAQRALDGFITEWQSRAKLSQRGFAHRSKLLFHGPPGCGKSVTAQALGKELNLPVYMVRFDAVIGAFLGQTAIHLRQLFHFAETTPCVLLLDELDALGKKRGNPLDVGELDRIVISLLQELEHSVPLGVVVATTNLPRHLDDALWRRFDLDIVFPAPSRRSLTDFVRALAKHHKAQLPRIVFNKAINASSYAAAEKAVDVEIRRQIIEGD